MPHRSRPCIFAPQTRLQATPPGAAACARLARPISTSPTRQRCSYGAAAAWCHLDSSPRGDSAGCKCSPSQTCITLLRASRRPPDTPRTCRLSSGQLPIRETGSAVNKAPHTSASGPSAGIGTTLGLSCGSVLYFIMNQPNNIQSLCGAHALAHQVDVYQWRREGRTKF